MKKMVAILGVVLISSTAFNAAPLFARDSMHLVCAGFMEQEPGPSNYGISVIFDEYRSDGSIRNESLSSVFAGNLYQGINIDSDWGEKQSITIASKADSKYIFFKGQYQVISNTNGKYELTLVGQMNLEPDGSAGEDISTTLGCVDISN